MSHASFHSPDMERSKLYDILDRAGDAAFAVEPDGQICYWSQNASLLLGFAEGQVHSKNCAEILAGKDSSGCEICGPDCPVLELSRKGHSSPTYDLHALTASGARKWISVSVMVAPVTRGPSPLTVHLMRDIGERKLVEDFARQIMVRVSELTGREAGKIPLQGPLRVPRVKLTPRETEVLQFLSSGKDTKAISADLRISVATVRNHVQRILRKLRCHSRLAAVTRAAREGLI